MIETSTPISKRPLIKRPLARSLWRGFSKTCPNCATGAIYGKYLKIVHACATCDEELHHHRADDAPPYFTIFIVGHVVLWAVLITERTWRLDTSVHMMLWIPAVLGLTFWLLPRIKGAIVALQWALGLHGFECDETAPPRTAEIQTASAHLDK